MDIKKIIREICSEDPMTFENAFHTILPDVENFKDDLIAAMKREKNGKMRARFIELLGYCSDESLINDFEKELSNSHHDVVSWTLFALEKNPSPKGKDIARKFRKENPEFSE